MTFWCSKIDFTYFERFPNTTKTWSNQRQQEYGDYVQDINGFKIAFCAEICGDSMTHHEVSSRHLENALHWAREMDDLRYSLQIDDYVSRPLRIWMYEKASLITNATNVFTHEADWIGISKEYQMYSPEYYLQDYFQRLSTYNRGPWHNFEWAANPLVADYYIIPSDLMFYSFDHQPAIMTNEQFKDLHVKLNNYFETQMGKVCTMFPYWTMATQPDQRGANHIIAFPGGRNMGLLYENMQNLLKNIIQLAFTGIRQDLLPPNAPPQYVYRNVKITYRHRYDVLIPQFTRLRLSGSALKNLNMTLRKKKHLFYFAGTLSKSLTSQSARFKLTSLWKSFRKEKQYKMKTQIEGRQFDTIIVIDGHVKPVDYMESIRSSVFSLCPEGYLPWSLRLYEAIQIGAIPVILADSIVLPFERFIDWRSFTVKFNVSNIEAITNFFTRVRSFVKYVKQKLENASLYLDAFRWPYAAIGENGHKKHEFLPEEDKDGSVKNVFYYISLELRCRRLEQLYGLTSESFSVKSIQAQQQACKYHPKICPCHNERRKLAFQQYI